VNRFTGGTQIRHFVMAITGSAVWRYGGVISSLIAVSQVGSRLAVGAPGSNASPSRGLSYEAVPKRFADLAITHCADNGIAELLDEVDDQLELGRLHYR
jgi:hypothetical protein